jgi:hypothetical protein
MPSLDVVAKIYNASAITFRIQLIVPCRNIV